MKKYECQSKGDVKKFIYDLDEHNCGKLNKKAFTKLIKKTIKLLANEASKRCKRAYDIQKYHKLLKNEKKLKKYSDKLYKSLELNG